MKFYRISIKITGLGDPDNRPNKTPPSAYLDKSMVGGGFLHFDERMSDVDNKNKFYYLNTPANVPTFDYFELKELYAERKKKYDWILLDVYGMVAGFMIYSWLVSGEVKK